MVSENGARERTPVDRCYRWVSGLVAMSATVAKNSRRRRYHVMFE